MVTSGWDWIVNHLETSSPDRRVGRRLRPPPVSSGNSAFQHPKLIIYLTESLYKLALAYLCARNGSCNILEPLDPRDVIGAASESVIVSAWSQESADRASRTEKQHLPIPPNEVE